MHPLFLFTFLLPQHALHFEPVFRITLATALDEAYRFPHFQLCSLPILQPALSHQANLFCFISMYMYQQLLLLPRSVNPITVTLVPKSCPLPNNLQNLRAFLCLTQSCAMHRFILSSFKQGSQIPSIVIPALIHTRSLPKHSTMSSTKNERGASSGNFLSSVAVTNLSLIKFYRALIHDLRLPIHRDLFTSCSPALISVHVILS